VPDPRQDEFYVGYLPRAPKGIASRVRMTVIGLFVVALVAGLLLVHAQRSFPPSVFEYGVLREFTGIIVERPYPMLLVERPGAPGAESSFSRYFLTVFGKHGAGAKIAGLDGRTVRFEGFLIYRHGQTDAAAPTIPGDREIDLGEMTLTGEIVDSKCFLGVMKPGRLKPHRSCAVRCISGGIPPVLLVRDAQGNAGYFLLVSSTGEAVNQDVLDRVAEPVEITGRVVRLGEMLLLKADPSSYRRL
jgi:hypothetical protein